MSIAYVKVKRTINVGASPGEKFLARIVREQPVELDLIAEQIAGASTMSKADVMGVLQQLQVQMSYHLLRGATVKLGLLGTFSPSLRAKAVETVDEVTVNSIRGLYIIFRPSTWLDREVKNVGYRLVDPTIEGLQVDAAAASLYGEDGEPDSTNVTEQIVTASSRSKKSKTDSKTSQADK